MFDPHVTCHLGQWTNIQKTEQNQYSCTLPDTAKILEADGIEPTTPSLQS